MVKIDSLNQSLKETSNVLAVPVGITKLAVPLRITKNEVCLMLGIGRDKLSRLEREDESFPKGMKEGFTRQAAVFYDYQEIVDWYENWKSMMRTATYS